MIIEEIIKYNEEFVANKGYEKYLTSKYPDKKLAILSCMDTRLTELLPAALGLKNEMPSSSRMQVDWLSVRSTPPCAASWLPFTNWV